MAKKPRRWHTPKEEVYPKEFIDAGELKRVIRKQLKGKLRMNFRLYMGDDRYFLTPVEHAKEIISNSSVDRLTYVERRFDCDDFAFVLKAHFCEAAYKDGDRRAAHCFGIVWGMLPGPHAINWMVNEDRVLRFVEPQSDEVFEPRQSDRDIWFMIV